MNEIIHKNGDMQDNQLKNLKSDADGFFERMRERLTERLLTDVRDYLRENRMHDSPTNGMLSDWLLRRIDMIALLALREDSATRHELDSRIGMWMERFSIEIMRLLNRNGALESLQDRGLIELVPTAHAPLFALTDEGRALLKEMSA